MATVLPPPSKRQKTEAAVKAREQKEQDVIPEGLGNVRVQFVDQATGKAASAPVQISVANATVKNLELLLNTLQGNVSPSYELPSDCAEVAKRRRRERCFAQDDYAHSLSAVRARRLSLLGQFAQAAPFMRTKPDVACLHFASLRTG